MKNDLAKFLYTHPHDYEEILSKPPYCLKISHDGPYVLFKYNQLDSDFSIPLVQEARGIIFRQYGESFMCVRRAFDKFFNYGEPNCAQLDLSGIVVQEKVDGSLMSVWWDDGWHLSTNGSIDAYKTPTNSPAYKTFGDLFDRALQEYGYKSFAQFCNDFAPERTYTFELCTEENQVVIPYEGFHIFYLGERENYFGLEFFDNDFASRKGIEAPKYYSMTSIEEVVEVAQKLSWNEEGFVVRDRRWNRAKVKSLKWLEAHYALNNGQMSWFRLIDVVLHGEEDEFLVFGQKYREYIEKIHLRMNQLEELATKTLAELRCFDYGSRAEWASAVKLVEDPSVRAFCFANYGQEISWKDYTKTWDTYRWERVLQMDNQ